MGRRGGHVCVRSIFACPSHQARARGVVMGHFSVGHRSTEHRGTGTQPCCKHCGEVFAKRKAFLPAPSLDSLLFSGFPTPGGLEASPFLALLSLPRSIL